MQITISVEPGTTLRRLGRRRRLVIAGLALALTLPGVALASHIFADVPDSSPFHADISRVYGARVAAGCGGGNYCPSTAVTRDQMAAFLNRVGSRGTFGAGGWTPMTGTEADLATVQIRAGNVTGGTAIVVVNVAISTYSETTTGCPCAGTFVVRRDGGGESNYVYTQVNELSGGIYAFDSAAISFAMEVPTGVTQTFRIRGNEYAGTATLNARVNATAIYAPFGYLGTNQLNADSLTEVTKGLSGRPE